MTTAAYGPIVRPEEAASDRYCLGCGYNLRGLGAGNCPECGRVSDGREYAGLQLPWLQRAPMGTLEAYWRTVWLVTFRPGEFAARFQWPQVRHHGSPSFRAHTVAYATAALLVTAGALAWQGQFSARGIAALLGALLPSAVAFFYAATDLVSYLGWIGPATLSNSSEEGFRARVINEYASAALAWTPLPAMAVLAGVAATTLVGPEAGEIAFPLAALLYAAIAVTWLLNVLVSFGRALSLGTGSLAIAAILFPVRCACIAFLTIVFLFFPLACCIGGLLYILS